MMKELNRLKDAGEALREQVYRMTPQRQLIMAALCERTIVLDEGTVVADDATLNIMSNTDLPERHGLAPASPIMEHQA
jgi:ABC-type dipeptide/oligopeptide/nickel transport system ATPase subunit